MPLFVYKAASDTGQTHTDRIERDNIADVAEYLRQKGLYPWEIRKLTILNQDLYDLLKIPIGLKTVAVICRQLNFFLESGIRLPLAFQIMSAQAKDIRVKRMLMDIHGHSLKGNSLSDCLKSAPLPTLMPALCRVGEESGKLRESISQLADYYEREHKNMQAVAGALLYPAILAVMMVIISILAVVYVIPNYTLIFEAEGISLPFITQVLMSGSAVLLDYGFFILAAFLSIILPVIMFFRTDRGKLLTGFIKLHIPLWRLDMNLRFSKCMSMLLSAGKPPPEAMSIIYEAIGNTCLDNMFLHISAGLKQGRKLSALLAEAKHFDSMLINMVEIGEETGSLYKPLSQCAAYYQSEREHASALITKLAEPFIMILVGSVLAVIMLSIMLPTFELINTF